METFRPFGTLVRLGPRSTPCAGCHRPVTDFSVVGATRNPFGASFGERNARERTRRGPDASCAHGVDLAWNAHACAKSRAAIAVEHPTVERVCRHLDAVRRWMQRTAPAVGVSTGATLACVREGPLER